MASLQVSNPQVQWSLDECLTILIYASIRKGFFLVKFFSNNTSLICKYLEWSELLIKKTSLKYKRMRRSHTELVMNAIGTVRPNL